MDRATHERRTPRRVLSVLAAFALVAGMLVILAPGAGAVVNTCKARNLTKGTPVDTNLQRVIKAASPGDTISVKYVCVGNFKIAKKLSLVGKATPGVPKAVLNGNGTGRTLWVSAQVRLTNLKITGGKSLNGGGIYNTGTLTLKDTMVRGNTGDSGGGIANRDAAGTVTLNGSSSVSGNSAVGAGGIENFGAITMNDSSSVSDNTTAGAAGGIYNEGTVSLNGSSSVSGNASGWGGGILNHVGSVTLNGSSSVSGNTTFYEAGGIENLGTITMNDSSTVSGNRAGGTGGGIYTARTLTLIDSSITLNDSSSVSGNTTDSDDDLDGTGGGAFVACDSTLTGGVDGGNVNDNFRGTASPVEDNIAYETGCV